jgi:hypothetical protein
MTADSYISDAMRAIVGRRYGEAESFPIARSDIRRWAIAVYYPELPPRLYYDEGYAQGTDYRGIVAPEDFNPFAWASARPDLAMTRRASYSTDDVENACGIEGPGLKSGLNAGSSVVYGVRMRPDDVISAVSEVVEYAEKTGRLGRMLITITRATWTNQRGELVRVRTHTGIRY